MVGNLDTGHSRGKIGRLNGQPRATTARFRAIFDIAFDRTSRKLPLDFVARRITPREFLEHSRRQVQVAFFTFGTPVDKVNGLRRGGVTAARIVARHLSTPAAILRRFPLFIVQCCVILAHTRVVHKVAITTRYLAECVGRPFTRERFITTCKRYDG